MQFMKLQIEFGGDVNEVSYHLFYFIYVLFKIYLKILQDHGSLQRRTNRR
jgi:hypothetical protein